MHPGDSKASCRHVMIEQSRPEYNGALAVGQEVPMHPSVDGLTCY